MTFHLLLLLYKINQDKTKSECNVCHFRDMSAKHISRNTRNKH